MNQEKTQVLILYVEIQNGLKPHRLQMGIQLKKSKLSKL